MYCKWVREISANFLIIKLVINNLLKFQKSFPSPLYDTSSSAVERTFFICNVPNLLGIFGPIFGDTKVVNLWQVYCSDYEVNNIIIICGY